MEGFFEIIWLLLIVFFLFRTFFSQARKSREQRRPAETEANDSAETDTLTKTRDEILEEFKNIFGPPEKPELPTRPRRRPDPLPAEGTAAPQKTPKKYESYSGTDFIDTIAESPDLSEIDRLEVRSPSLLSKNEPSGKFDFLYGLEDIRRGIIISEILGKPKALKNTLI